MAESTEETALTLSRSDDFVTLYANNVRYESSAWDLKMLFGQLDQSHTPRVIDQHTAVTLSWPNAKIAAYYLLVNVLLHQTSDGKIDIPARVLPERPNAAEPGLDDNGRRTVAYLAWVHDQFFGDDPFVPPGLDA